MQTTYAAEMLQSRKYVACESQNVHRATSSIFRSLEVPSIMTRARFAATGPL